MIAAWMVYASLLGALFGLAALAVERAARALRLTWLASRALWAASLGATLVLPLALAVRALAPTAPTAPAAARGRVTIVARGPALSLNVVPSTDTSAALPPRFPVASRASRAYSVSVPSTPALDRALLVAWLAGGLLTLAFIVHSSAGLGRRRRTWSRREVLGTPVLVAEDFGPAVIGVFRPEIVLPAWALSAEAVSLDLILRHETEHRRARDTLLLAACGCTAALCPWNVALWWQLGRLRLATEIDCDARVLAREGDARAYATVLVDAGERMQAMTMLAPAFVERRSLLEQRILAMSAARAPRRLLPALALAAAASLCVAIACSAPSPRGTAPESAPLPAQFARAAIAQQQYYPRVVRIDTVDAAGTAWLRAALARYYPRVLTGDTSLAFVSFYLSSDGRIVSAAARPRTDIGADTTDAPFPFDFGAYRYGNSAPASDNVRVAAERATFQADQDTLFASQIPTRSVLGMRTVLPREFTYDSLSGTAPDDPFLGADPHAFQRDDEIFLTPEMLPPHGVSIHVLTLRPGRGGPTDFGHRVSVRKTPLTPPPPPPRPQPDIEHLGDLPGGGWAITAELWATLEHKPVILIDGAVRRFEDMMALMGHADTIVNVQRIVPAAAMRLTHDSAAANGAIVVTTKGHRPPSSG